MQGAGRCGRASHIVIAICFAYRTYAMAAVADAGRQRPGTARGEPFYYKHLFQKENPPTAE